MSPTVDSTCQNRPSLAPTLVSRCSTRSSLREPLGAPTVSGKPSSALLASSEKVSSPPGGSVLRTCSTATLIASGPCERRAVGLDALGLEGQPALRQAEPHAVLLHPDQLLDGAHAGDDVPGRRLARGRRGRMGAAGVGQGGLRAAVTTRGRREG